MFLLISVTAHVIVTVRGADPFKMVDLRVYVDGAGHLFDGRLYDFMSGSLKLPFTYPPFSAFVFQPLHALPWTLTRVLWQVGSLGSIAMMTYLTLRLLGRAGPGAKRPVDLLRVVAACTALAVWLEPVRTNLNYGQINLFLAVLLLGGAVAAKEWVAGASVGLAAGTKLVPAVTGLYYLLSRSFGAARWAVVFFLATVGLMWAIVPQTARTYFTTLMLRPGRAGPIFSVINQSWRGALDRLSGGDAGLWWWTACVASVALGLLAAWSAVSAGDRTAALLAVQFTGLLVSPISWSHHWVWVLPLLVWMAYGPRRRHRVVRALAAGWLLALYSYLIPVLITLQGRVPAASRPGWQAWLGAAYPVLGLATLLVLGQPIRGCFRHGQAVAGSTATRVRPLFMIQPKSAQEQAHPDRRPWSGARASRSIPFGPK